MIKVNYEVHSKSKGMVDMTSVFKSVQKHALLRSIAYILLGIAITINPEQVSGIILNIIVGYNVLMGIINLISGLRHKVDGYNPSIGIAIFNFICALLIFLFALPLAKMLPILLGLAFIIGGGIRMVQAMNLKQYVNVNWIAMLIYGIFMIGAGVVLISFPFSTLMVTFRVFGVMIIISGISELIAFIRFRNYDL